MNSANDSLLLRQRCRQWSPLITQQLRLRHLYQIFAYNVVLEAHGSLYYTLHLTSMSAPFYTSEKLNNINPRWGELNLTNVANLSATAFVLRIWQKQENNKDIILLTWGINLSGLIYLGNKVTDLQPILFNENSVILQLRGGYFSSLKCLKSNTPNSFILSKNVNVTQDKDCLKILKYSNMKYAPNETKASYDVNKLRKLHSLQIRIRNKSLDVQMLRDEINTRCPLCTNNTQEIAIARTEPEKSPNIRYAPQLLTMNCLNKMLQEKPTLVQMREIIKIRKEIEIFRFRTKLLLQEKDRKSANIRQLKQTYTKLSDSNEDTDYKLLENYRKLSKEIEKLKEWKREQIHHHEELIQISSQLHHRRRQLVSQLLVIYPIAEAQKKYYINNIHLPDADLLADYADNGLSAALGYVAHILTMCASFLQVPLRYPVFHVGSRSYIVDNVSPQHLDREREFPLYTKGKDRMQFVFAVYLLNKNIAQLRCLYGLNTVELKSTLANLLTFLQGKDSCKVRSLEGAAKTHPDVSVKDSVDSKPYDFVPQKSNSVKSDDMCSTTSNLSNLNFTLNKEEQVYDTSFTPSHRKCKPKQSETGPGLSEILAVPEAFLNKQITSTTFKTYISKQCLNKSDKEAPNSSVSSSSSQTNGAVISMKNNANKDHVEEGTDLMNTHNSNVILKRKSRSVGSYTDDESLLESKNNFEVGSDPLINVSSDTNPGDVRNFDDMETTEVDQREFLEKWLDNGPALIAAEESLYPEEILGVEESSTSTSAPDRPLTLRTDALLNTTSFNLVKPKL